MVVVEMLAVPVGDDGGGGDGDDGCGGDSDNGGDGAGALQWLCWWWWQQFYRWCQCWWWSSRV